jgi:hypothetical protein
VDGNTLTPTFNKYTYEYNVIVGSGVSSIKVGAEAISASASVSGTGSYSLKYGVNEIDITVTAGNGTTRTYTINVARGSTQSGSDGNVSSSRYSFDTENSLITGISVGTGVDDVLSNITFVSGGNAKMTDASGSAKTGSVATGDIVNVYDSSGNKLASYSAVVKGDVNGDGVIDILDIVRIKNQMLDTTLLSGAYMSAADIDGNGAVDLIDIVKAKNMILAQ